MKLLTIDTATPSCSVAVTAQGRGLVEINVAVKQTHARHVMVMVDHALALARMELTDLDGFGVVRGPGTFTGLRIGISTVKALASVAAKPIAAVSSLRALAWQNARRAGLIGPMIDARRGEVYGALYRYDGSRLVELLAPRVCPVEQMLARIDEPCLFMGSGSVLYAQAIEARGIAGDEIASEADSSLRASAAGELCTRKLCRNETVAVDALVPLYLRKSDAELNFGKIA